MWYLLSFISVALTGSFFSRTLMEQEAENLPSDVLTEMMASPEETALTVPSFTVATASLLLSHFRLLSAALSGSKVTESASVAPISSSALSGETEIPLSTGVSSPFSLTVTEQVAVLPPLTVVTVIVALPGDTATTVPSLTLATPLSLLDHLTLLSVASDGSTLAVRMALCPTSRLILVGDTLTPLTATSFSLGVQPTASTASAKARM